MDNNETAAPAIVIPEPAPTQPDPAPKFMGLPMDMFVKGGTRTSAHDAEVAKHKADAERRRAELDDDRALASSGQGKLFTNNLADNPGADKAYVLLKYLMRNHREISYECLADITLLENGELCLIMVCPCCMADGLPMDLCQMSIKQSNKAWELDLRTAGELIIFDDQPYKSAGRVRECPLFKCGQCGWAARIDDNKVYPA